MFLKNDSLKACFFSQDKKSVYNGRPYVSYLSSQQVSIHV